MCYAFEVHKNGDFLDFDVATDILKQAGFPLVAEPIVRGSFQECVGIDVDLLRTSIPGLLGLPSCEEKLTIVEGIVVRPVQRPPQTNWLLKKKSWGYLEINPNEFNKALAELTKSPARGV